MVATEETTLRRLAILSVHTCPLALLGGKKTGGMNVYVREFARAIGQRGVAVDVFTRSQDDCVPRVRHDLGYGGRVIHVPAGPERPIPVAEVEQYLDEFVAGVVAFAREEGITYDVIHSHYWLSGLVAEGLRHAWGEDIPIVHMFHTLGHMKNRIALSPAERASPARIEGERRVLQIADRIIAATPAEVAQLNWLYGANMEKVSVISLGVDLERFRPIPREQARANIGVDDCDQLILFVGRIEPLKGVDTLLRAIALIRQRRPEAAQNLCVSIIGGDPWAEDPDEEMARLQALRRELQIKDTVTFLGARDQDALPDYYAAAEMVVMPSHYESFGLVALEAMAMGTPVIASEVGGLAFVVRDGETGFHVPSRDPEALADKIYRLLTDDACREQLGRQAHQHARQYSWDIVAGRMLRVYNSLLAERRLREGEIGRVRD